MEIMNKENMNDLCLSFGLGKVMEEPVEVKGGLLHSMIKVTTDKGIYAIKYLNPDIMRREHALNNMINSEKISEILSLHIPAIIAKKVNTKHVHPYKEQYFMFFDWMDGKSIYPPAINEIHCNAIGDIVGKIHSLNIYVDGIVREIESNSVRRWLEFNEITKENKASWANLYNETLEDIMSWSEKAVNAKTELLDEMVISHRDLDPKNVMWKGSCPFIIDWEAAGYVNPNQELLEVLNYWADDGNGGLDKILFMAVLSRYKTHKSIHNVNWDVVLDSGYEGMLGWLEYNVKRALGIEASNVDEILLGEQQVIHTIADLKRYQKKMSAMKEWLKE